MFRWFRKHVYFVVALVLPIALSFIVVRPASADEADQDRAREALEKGEARPLIEVLEKVEAMYRGEALDVELEEEEHDGVRQLVYEIKLLTPDGNLLNLYFDAQSLDLITASGHDIEKARKHRSEDDDRDGSHQ